MTDDSHAEAGRNAAVAVGLLSDGSIFLDFGHFSAAAQQPLVLTAAEAREVAAALSEVADVAEQQATDAEPPRH